MIKKLAFCCLLVLAGACAPPGSENDGEGAGSGTPQQTETSTPPEVQITDEGSESPDSPESPEAAEAAAVVEHFKAEGLPIGRFDAYSAETSPFSSIGGARLYKGLAIFNDTRVEPVTFEDSDVLKFDQSGGIVEIFASPEELQTRAQQIDAVRQLAAERGTELEPEFQAVQGTILLRLGHVMEEWVGEYEAALASYQG